MKNRLRFIVLFLFLANGQLHMVFAQKPSHSFGRQVDTVGLPGQKATVILDSLEAELFDRKEEKVLLYKFLHDCKNQKIDSSIMVRGDQPNPLKCMQWMRDLAWIGDTNSISRIQAVYDRHMLTFVQEWKKAYLTSSNSCKEITNQYYVLSSFENLLMCLQIKRSKLNPAEIFESYKAELEVDDRYFGTGLDVRFISSETKVFNDEFRTLGFPRFKPSPTFHYCAPYLQELRSFLTQYVKDLTVNEDSVQFKKFLLLSSRDLYYPLEDTMLQANLLRSYKFFEANQFLVFLYEYCRIHYCPAIVRKLSRSTYEKQKIHEPYYTSIMLRTLFLNERNKPVFYEELVLIAKKDVQKVVSFISEFLPKQEAVAQLKGLKTNDRPTRKLIERMIKDLQLQKQNK